MREPKNCQIVYCGYEKPSSREELDFEILGLQHAIKKIEERIALLKQSQYIAKVAINNNASFIEDMFGRGNESDSNKVIKEKGNSEENKNN